ncbi:metal-dependent hydrolase family protein [Nocardia sp. alder85J]|uniref:metal-dependent hydrolase family protein n=1 Tax=Nocardia sp. alder85J TaxID=2862949 RepID=UPI001CD78400|nr:amidohydrolase family protein [Nocardia sp. alder85J]MCX4091349.1 amidohydrolase family protein [Nocardia sp. alder85J]
MTTTTVLRAARWLDTDTGQIHTPAVLVIDGDRITAVNPVAPPPDTALDIDLGDVTLLPGLMDMELNLLIGGPGGPEGLPLPMHGVQDDPVYRTLRGAVNARTTLDAGFTTVRNLGLMVKTGGYLLDVALQRAIDQGWHPGPRIVPAGHAVTPYGGHLDPTVFQRLAPGIMPLGVAEGIANGVPDVRACVRYQVRHGAKVIKVSASGGVMSHSTSPGSQQYSDEEFVAIADEAHRAGLRVAAHAVGDTAIRACIRAGIDCIEHGFLASDETLQMMVDHGTFLVSTTYLTEALAVDRVAPELRRKAAEVFPRAQEMLPKAIAAGVRIACGTDAPAIPHGRNADELSALVRRGMTPAQAVRAATVTSAELIAAEDELGRLAPGYLADIIAVPGDPSRDITVLQNVPFVMKGGQLHKRP